MSSNNRTRPKVVIKQSNIGHTVTGLPQILNKTTGGSNPTSNPPGPPGSQTHSGGSRGPLVNANAGVDLSFGNQYYGGATPHTSGSMVDATAGFRLASGNVVHGGSEHRAKNSNGGDGSGGTDFDVEIEQDRINHDVRFAGQDIQGKSELLKQKYITNLTKIEQSIRSIKSADIKFVKSIGNGNFGSVSKVSVNGQIMAAKTPYSASNERDSQMELCLRYFLQESFILHTLNDNPNIVQAKGFCFDSKPYWTLLLEYIPGGSLNQYLYINRDKLPERNLISICMQIANACAYLHEKNFIHCDVSARNVLVANQNLVKLADFGLTKPLTEEDSFAYVLAEDRPVAPPKPPETQYTNCNSLTFASDVWYFGAFIIEVYNLHSSKKTLDELNKELKQSILTTMPAFKRKPLNAPEAVKELSQHCCTDNPEHRPMFSKILEALKKECRMEPELNRFGEGLLQPAYDV